MILKILIFSISKSHFIIFNISLYNTLNIKTYIFFLTTSFKYYFFIIFYSFFVFIFFILSPSWSHYFSLLLRLSLFLNPTILPIGSHQPPQFQWPPQDQRPTPINSMTHTDLPSRLIPMPVRDPQTHQVTKSNHPVEIKTENPDPWNQTT